ncbi:MAG TPA: flagellar hook-associated protein FlgL [Bacillota bacterium]|nr:flagellar hook-associated protein FlgL [Bacillota bacterium]
MRVTHRMMAESVSQNLRLNLYRLDRLSNQLASGKVFTKPSQNPVGVSRSMLYKTALNRNEQYRLNTNEARGWLSTTHDALMKGLEVLQRLRELSVAAANGTYSDTERSSIASEAVQLKEHLLALANTQHNELYIFGGHRTLEPPYAYNEEGQLEYRGDLGHRVQEVGTFQQVVMNLNGQEAFGGVEVFEAVEQICQALLEDDSETLSGEALEKIDRGIDLFLQRLADVGARQLRVETMYDTLFEQSIYLKQMLSELEDIDYAETITEFQMQENAYRAALATAARMMQPSLVDYLS